MMSPSVISDTQNPLSAFRRGEIGRMAHREWGEADDTMGQRCSLLAGRRVVDDDRWYQFGKPCGNLNSARLQ